jgi:hypothetical protein
MKTVFIFLSAILFSVTSSAQSLVNSTKGSYYTWLYRINDDDAGKLYRKGYISDPESFLTGKPVDSVPAGSGTIKNLQPGHYLAITVEGSRLVTTLVSSQYLIAGTVSNSTDLCVAVYDTSGNEIDNAKVSCRGRRMKYDESRRLYVLRKANTRGLLQVEYAGSIFYYDLSRQMWNPALKRAGTALVTSTPLKYVWRPVSFIAMLPVDAVKALAGVYPRRSFSVISYRTRRFIDFFSRHGSERDEFSERNPGRYRRYFVFNKPMFLPGDTVKFKAYVTNKNGKGLSGEAGIYIRKDWDSYLKIGKVAAERDGNFNSSFVLHDSLGLKLDSYYKIILKRPSGRVIGSGDFRLSDYELKGTNLDISVPGEQYRGRKFTVSIRGTDENGLELPDGMVTVTATSGEVTSCTKQFIFLPDTLFHKEFKLENKGTTYYSVDDSLFPQASFSYNLNIKLARSDNETVVKKTVVKYYSFLNDFTWKADRDSVTFYCRSGSDSVKSSGYIEGSDRFGTVSGRERVTFPVKVKINPVYSQYRLFSEGVRKNVDFSEIAPGVECYSGRTHDSLWFRVENLRKLNIVWHVYRANRLLAKGFGTEPSFNGKCAENATHYFMISYLWAGKIQNKTFSSQPEPRSLNIFVSQPSAVYPGQKAEIELTVTDSKGRAVKGADLTSWAVTGKFGASSPNIPTWYSALKGKKLINTFAAGETEKPYRSNIPLKFSQWSKKAALDTMEYYRFLYPGGEVYTSYYVPADGETQFAPFIVKDGEIVPVEIIWLDYRPVWFGWIDNPYMSYSFRSAPGFHNLEIRTAERSYLVDSILLLKGKKLIIAVNDREDPSGYSVSKRKPVLSEKEKNQVAAWVFPFRNNFGDDIAYLANNGNIFLLNNPTGLPGKTPGYISNNYWSKNSVSETVGPVAPAYSAFMVPGGYTHNFYVEDKFEYDFSEKVIKMRSVDKEKLLPLRLNDVAVKRLTDLPLTEDKIQKEYAELLFQKKLAGARFNISKVNEPGNCVLIISLDSTFGNKALTPMYRILMKENDPNEMSVFPGNTNIIQNQSPGNYKIVIWFRDNSWLEYGPHTLKSGGKNFIRLSLAGTSLKRGDEGRLIMENIDRQIFHNYKVPEAVITDSWRQSLKHQYMHKYYGSGRVIEGVVSAEDGPLPGVSVTVKGTQFGVATDINGCYSINVPLASSELVYSYIGYKTFTLPIGPGVGNVTLEPDILALQEVVVTGYGFTRKSSVTASAVQVALAGRVAGITASSTDIRIRGISSASSGEQPLLIIDGVPYTGNLGDIDIASIRNIKVVKDEAITALYGSRAAGGVILISRSDLLSSGVKVPENVRALLLDPSFAEQADKQSSIRSRFSDYAWWQPSLVTDIKGKARFEARFPDDITSWQTHVIAMGPGKRSGTVSGTIKSFKPLSARLSAPRFLIDGDSANLSGLTANYRGDTVSGKSIFKVNGNPIKEREVIFTASLNDTLPVAISGRDTISAEYSFVNSNGYFDGELRKIPVFRRGVELSKGNFSVMAGDDTLVLVSDSYMGEATLTVTTSRFDVILDEVGLLKNYRYFCNEQLASKLKGLLASEKIAAYLGKKYDGRDDVQKIARILAKNQNEDGCWGWWSKSETVPWVTVHVAEAVAEAEKAGHRTGINLPAVTGYAVWRLESNADGNEKLRLLRLADITGAKIDYRKYLVSVDRKSLPSLSEKFYLEELKLKYNAGYCRDSIVKYADSTLFGSIFFTNGSEGDGLFNNRAQATVSAYRALRLDSSADKKMLDGIRNYFFECRKNRGWQNTFESATIIETVIPDMVGEVADKNLKAEVKVAGQPVNTDSRVPYTRKFGPGESITIIKKGALSAYVSLFQNYWSDRPSADSSTFTIKSRFADGNLVMKAGKSEKLVVDLIIRNDCEYMVVEIPIPGGCSYDSRDNYFPGSVYSEFHKEMLSVFFSTIRKGNYRFEINLLPRFTGKFSLNPAKCELMYQPVFSANNELKTVIVK